MLYGYARVSMTRQAIRGNSLEDQEHLLRAAGVQEIQVQRWIGPISTACLTGSNGATRIR